MTNNINTGTKTFTLSREQALALEAVLRNQIEAAPEDTHELLSDALRTTDMETTHAVWNDLLTAVFETKR